MKDKKNIIKIVVFTVVFVLMFAIILYFSLKDSYAIENGSSKLSESSAKIILDCDDNTNILPSEKKCRLKFDLEGANIKEISSITAKIEYINLTGSINQSSYTNEGWLGATDGGKIDLYTADNKTNGAILFEVELTPTSTVPSEASIKLTNIIISDENFDEYTLKETIFKLNVVDNNASLKSLSVENHSILPEFRSEITSYHLNVDSKTDKININAQTESNNATIVGTGTKLLEFGENNFEIIVTAQDGTTTKKYVLTITRVEEEKLEFASGVIVDNENKYLTLLLNRDTDICNPDASRDEEKICYSVKDFVNDANKKKIITNAETITLRDSEGNIINEENRIVTGTKLNITFKAGTSYDYTIILLGDIDGDGYIKLTDVARLFKYYKNKITLDDIYIKAGDVMLEGPPVSLNDVSRLFKFYRNARNSFLD